MQVALEGKFPDDLLWNVSLCSRHCITDWVSFGFVLFGWYVFFGAFSLLWNSREVFDADGSVVAAAVHGA
jgi:hypothetical protein